MTALKDLSEIFVSRLLRVPDYQRGYAWQTKELEDFWEDLMVLRDGKVHYTGVITLEPLEKSDTSSWEDDRWIIDDLGYKPFYVVDGQQRLTTAVILIHAILDTMKPDEVLNHDPVKYHFQKYILKQDGAGLRHSYVFGYSKDDPSFEFLKTRIFGQFSNTNDEKLTLYTQNLQGAKDFFVEKLQRMSREEINLVYKKLTTQFKFNVYEVDKEIDVFVTFETMNNRGKSLSNLEILKNRLIYLSTLYTDDKNRDALRKNINECWKTIYEYLGKNPDNRLPDDVFLRNHWIMYFTYSRDKSAAYVKYLLNEKFTIQNVSLPENDGNHVSIKEISDYINSLQVTVKYWFYIHNPYFSSFTNEDTSKNKMLLDRLNRLGFGAFKPLILSAYCSKVSSDHISELLQAADRYIFTLFSLSRRRSSTGDTEFYSAARKLLKNEISIIKNSDAEADGCDDIVTNINKWITQYYSPDKFRTYIKEKFIYGNKEGFYRWDDIRYFLFEYEEHLRELGEHKKQELNWQNFTESKKDYVSVEHIYPQTESDEWTTAFEEYSDEQKHYITHSLGNLLPLSRQKNSKLQNYSFKIKKDDGNGCGYYNGCCSENEVNKEPKWELEEIQKRGLDMLAFMEERWQVSLGDDDVKIELLGLKFEANKGLDLNDQSTIEAAE